MNEQPRTPLPEEIPEKDKKEKYLSDRDFTENPCNEFVFSEVETINLPHPTEESGYQIALCFVKPHKNQNYWELYSEARLIDAADYIRFSEDMKILVEGIVEDFLVEVFSSEDQFEHTVAYRTGEAS